jgi:rSAM/selenodomain-associated transferase 1
MPDRVALLFTKPSVPGRVKTRLIGDLSAAEAAELHAAFVADLLDRMEGGSFELRLAWALEAGEEAPPSDLIAVIQDGADIGERMYRALQDAAVDEMSVAAIGSDVPGLQRSDLEEAFERLESGLFDVVLGPALDGGYCLIALRSEALHPEIFEGVSWSTSQVLEETLERCSRLGLRTHQLRSTSDVDTPFDLGRLAIDLASGRVKAPQTERLLRRWNRLSAGTLEGSTG